MLEDSVYAFTIYFTLFRLGIIAVGLISIILGYRLFCRGVWPSGTGTTVDTEVGGSRFTLKNAAPGTCFALFGVIIISVMVTASPPKLHLDDGALTLDIRSPSDDQFMATIKRGIYYEEHNDTALAIDSYERAVAMMSTPINNLAWLYSAQGKTEDALSLSRLAVQLSPNNQEFLDTLAEILFKAGKYSEALKFMEKAAILNSKYRDKLSRFREAAK